MEQRLSKKVMILTGAGQIGMAIARRIGSGMKIVIGDKNIGNAHAIARTMNQAGFDTIPLEMDLSSPGLHPAFDCRSTEVRQYFHARQCSGGFPQPGIR